MRHAECVKNMLIPSMMMMAAAIVQSAPGLAQPAQPPTLARVEVVQPGPAKPGTPLKLVVNVTPRDGIHIYAPPQKEFKPVSLTVDAVPGVKIGKPQFPPAVTRTFEGEPIKVYDRAFSISVPVTVDARADGTASVSGKLLYQACDDLVCYRPVSTSVRWDIRIQ